MCFYFPCPPPSRFVFVYLLTFPLMAVVGLIISFEMRYIHPIYTKALKSFVEEKWPATWQSMKKNIIEDKPS